VTMQLYNVKLSAELVVLAESPEEAEGIANRHRADEECFVADAKPMTRIPDQWDRDCMPYRDRRNTIGGTLGELIDDGFAPDLTASTWTLTFGVACIVSPTPSPGGNSHRVSLRNVVAVNGKDEQRRFTLAQWQRQNGTLYYSVAQVGQDDDPFIIANEMTDIEKMLVENLEKSSNPLAVVASLLSAAKLPSSDALRQLLDAQQNDGTLTEDQWNALRDLTSAVDAMAAAIERWENATR
jgi:hypothetical protein